MLLVFAVVALLIVVAVLVLVVIRPRSAQTYAEDSPEGTIQRYLRALEEGDSETAYSFFSSEVQRDFPLQEFEDGLPRPEFGVEDGRRSVRVAGVETRGDTATLLLEVDEYVDLVPLSPEYQSELEVTLTHENGAWKIDEPLYGLSPAYGFFRGD